MKILLATILILIVPFTSLAAGNWPEVSCKQSESPVFQSNDVLEISLKGDFPVSDSANPAEIKYLGKTIPVALASRGKSRATCEFKPIRISWDKNKELKKGTIFENTKGQDMKLTVHCRYTEGTIAQNQDANEVIIKEYMIYKILKTFGLPAFDVRIAKVQYFDRNDKPTVEGMGFFIESSAQLADRCGLAHAKREETKEAVGPNMNKQIYIPYLFSRLITDASDFILEYDGGHNSEPFFKLNADPTAKKVTQVVVPYDFNDSGQVNSGVAPYWSFSPRWDYWFNLLRKGPFTRDGSVTALTLDQQKLWTEGIIEQAQQLVAKKDDVMKLIDESPLQQTSKNEFRAHVDMLIKQFDKLISEKGISQEGEIN